MARQGVLPVWVLGITNVLVWALVPGSLRFVVGGVVLLLLLIVINFYRDPERAVPVREGVFAVSPADGRVVSVMQSDDGLYISIFLSAFDVHVNRAPVSGRVASLEHTPGRFLPAFLARSSSDNERVTATFLSPEAGRVVCVQVAGLLARRIVNWVKADQELARGDRYGMIALGSRLDVTLEPDFTPLVARGQHVKAGHTPIAERPRG